MARGLATLVLLLGALLRPATASAGAVVVFPLDGRGVARETADLATEELKGTLRSLRSVEVIETGTVEKKLGVHLTEQARNCEYDVFCLVEVGELLHSERMVIGHVRRPPKGDPNEELELKLFVLDVAKAAVVDVLLWRVPGGALNLAEAVQAATRRLFAPPDAKLVLDLVPPNAEVFFYGDPVPRTLKGPLEYWSGAYQARVSAEGFVAKSLRFVIHPGETERLSAELDPDLLYVAKAKDKKVNPFAQSSRREGSGVTAEEAGAEVETGAPRRSAFLNPFAWTAAGAGAIATVVGVVIASGAQSDYNSLSKQERYLPGVTVSAQQAIESRQAERSKYQTGSIVALSGAAVVAGGLIWMIVDSATRGAPPAGSGQGPHALGEWHF